MSKVFKDEKIFNKFKKQFKFIFRDKNFIEISQNHFNKNGSFVVFTIAFLQCRIGEKRVFDNLKINREEWVDLFSKLYTDQKILDAQNKLDLNPLITLENIKKYFTVFDDFIDQFWQFVQEQGWDLNITKRDLAELLSNAYGYLLYNSIECKLNRHVDQILEDKKYDQKYEMILNNTKLFAEAKACILNHCEEKINDLIVILLGGSNHLALDK